jgi:hypothetical protein
MPFNSRAETRETVRDPTDRYMDVWFPKTIRGDDKLTTRKAVDDHM